METAVKARAKMEKRKGRRKYGKGRKGKDEKKGNAGRKRKEKGGNDEKR